MTSVSFGGNQRIAVNIDRSVFPSEEMFTKLGGFMEEELAELKKEAALVTSCKSSEKNPKSLDIV